MAELLAVEKLVARLSDWRKGRPGAFCLRQPKPQRLQVREREQFLLLTHWRSSHDSDSLTRGDRR